MHVIEHVCKCAYMGKCAVVHIKVCVSVKYELMYNDINMNIQ